MSLVLFSRELLQEFETAQMMPLFKRDLPEIHKFPYVFDSSIAAKQSASFLAGNRVKCLILYFVQLILKISPFFLRQMMLPENIKRNDNKMYEEISLEPSPPPPSEIGKDRVKISDLDKVSSFGFNFSFFTASRDFRSFSRLLNLHFGPRNN